MAIQSNYLPSLSPYLGGDLIEDARVANAPPPPNLFTSGIKSGFFEGISGAASAVGALGKLTGNQYLEQQGQAAAEEQAALAQQYGRPDLEGGIFSQTPQTFLPYVGYQLAKTVPTLATAIGATALVPQAAVPAGLARAAEFVPSFLRAGQTGAEFARAGLGAFAAQYPAISGGMYQQAKEREKAGAGEATAGDAAKAFLLGVPVTALGAIEPASLVGRATKGTTGNILQRFGKGAASNAAAESIQEGIEEAANMSFRPDISVNDKFKSIVDAAVTGGILGGITGGVLGIHKAKERPQDISTEDLGAKVDEVLMLPAPAPKQLQYEGTGIGPIEQGYEQRLGLPSPIPRQLQSERTPYEVIPQREGVEPLDLGPISSPQLEPPLDRNRPLIRNPVQTSNILPGEDLAGKIPEKLEDPLISEMKANAKRIGELTDLVKGEYLGKEKADRVKAEIARLEGNQSQLTKSAGLSIEEQIKNHPDLFRNPEVYGNLEARINDKRVKLTDQEKKLGQDLGLLKENGRKRDIDSEIVANDARQETILDKLNSKRAKRNPGLQTKLQAQLDDAKKVRAELDQFKSLREQSDALRESSTTQVDVREQARNGEALAERIPEEQQVTGTREAIQEPKVQEPIRDVKVEEVNVPIQSKVDDPVTTIQDMINEQLADPETKPIVAPPTQKKTSAQLQRDRILFARQQIPSTTETVRERPKGPQFSKEVRQADIAVRKEAEKIERANESIQKLTQDKQSVIVNPETKINFKRSIEERINSIPTNNAFDRGFKKAIDVLGESISDRIDVVNSFNDLPDNVIAEMHRQGVNSIEAVYDRDTGRTILVKDKFKNPTQVQQTIFHEIIGHDGLQRIAGKDYDNLMSDIFDRAGGLQGFENIGKKFGLSNTFNDYVASYNDGLIGKSELVDEFLAHAAERPKGKIGAAVNAFIGDIKRGVVGFLRSIGFNEFANKFNRFDNFEVARMLRDMRQAVVNGTAVDRPVQNAVAFKRSVDGTESTFSDATQLGDKILQNINRAGFGPKNISSKVRQLGLYWNTLTGIAEQHRDKLPSVDRLVESWHNRDVVAQRFNEIAGNVYKDITSLSKQDQNLFDNVANSTLYGFDLRKSWDVHQELHNLPNSKELEVEFNKLQKDLQKLEESYKKLNPKIKQGEGIYDKAIALGESENYAKAASDLYSMVNLLYRNERLPEFQQNPAKVFQNAKDVHGDVLKSRDFWKMFVERQIKGIEEFLGIANELNQEAIKDLSEVDKKKIQDRIKRGDILGIEKYINKKVKEVVKNTINTMPLAGRLDQVQRQLATTTKSPYFSLGRDGNYFVTFNLPLDERGLPKTESVIKLQDALEEKGFGDVFVGEAAENNGVYIRVENEDVMDSLYSLTKQLQKEGVVDQSKEILRGPRTQPNILQRLAPKYTDQLLNAIDKHVDTIDPQSAKVRDAMKAEMRAMVLDTLPSKSITRVYQQRKGRQGFSKNAVRNMVFRSQVTANAISNLAILSDVSEAFGDMRKQALSATADPNANPVELNQVINELSTREGQRPFQQPNSIVDALRGLNFTYFLGMSPAYMMQQVSQVPIIGWPELAKQHGVGFVKSAKALISVTTPAFKIMKAVSEGRYGLDAHIDKIALEKAGFKGANADYILNLINRGDIDLGSFGRELSRIEHGRLGSGVEHALRWANSTIVYSETFSRLQMALAAQKLGLTEDQASSVLKNSMFTYGNWNSPRAMGKMGIAGQLSPLMFAFHNYQVQMLEKMYREINTAFFNKAKSPAERAAARKFLGGHIAAATAVAGSLGLPGAAWFAGAASRLTDLFDDEGEGYDVQVAYRNWLATTFGKDFGEIIARGLPRALGVDTQNYGDQNLLPFSKLMQDRSKFEDAFPAYLKDLSGAPFSMLGNMVVGGRRIAEGDFLGGLKQATPRAFQAGIDAFRMTNEGYVDNKGNKLPLDASAANILTRALGFQTAERAEYNEAAQAVRVQKGQEGYNSGVIKSNLARAIESGDQETAREVLKQAQKFDQAHPDRQILPNFTSYLQRRQKDKLIAEQLNTPLGVRPENLGLRGLSSFANF